MIVFTEYRDTQRWLPSCCASAGLGGDRARRCCTAAWTTDERERIKAGVPGRPGPSTRCASCSPPTPPARASTCSATATGWSTTTSRSTRTGSSSATAASTATARRSRRRRPPLRRHRLGATPVDSFEADLEFLSRVARKVAHDPRGPRHGRPVLADAGRSGGCSASTSPLDDEPIDARPRGRGRCRSSATLREQVGRLRDAARRERRGAAASPRRASSGSCDTALSWPGSRRCAAPRRPAPSRPAVRRPAADRLLGSGRPSDGLERPDCAPTAAADHLRPRPWPRDRDDVVLAHLGHRLVAHVDRGCCGPRSGAAGDTGLHRVTAVRRRRRPCAGETCSSARTPGSCSSAPTGTGCTRRSSPPAAGCAERGRFARLENVGDARRDAATRAGDGARHRRLARAGWRDALAERRDGVLRRDRLARRTPGSESWSGALAERAPSEQRADRRQPRPASRTPCAASSPSEDADREQLISLADFDEPDERAQFDRDREPWRERLDRLPAEIGARARRRSRARYADPSRTCSRPPSSSSCPEEAADDGTRRGRPAIDRGRQQHARLAAPGRGRPARSSPCRCCSGPGPTASTPSTEPSATRCAAPTPTWRDDPAPRRSALGRARARRPARLARRPATGRRRRTLTALAVDREHDATSARRSRSPTQVSTTRRATPARTSRRRAARLVCARPGPAPTARVPGDGWAASPVDRLAAAAAAHRDVPLGLVTDGRWWALVWAPRGGVTVGRGLGRRAWLEEPTDVVRAFVALLARRRFFGVPDDETPRGAAGSAAPTPGGGHRGPRRPGPPAPSSCWSPRSAGPTRDRQRRAPARDVDRDEVYRGAVTVMMRLVFLLFAEERRCCPATTSSTPQRTRVGRLRDAAASSGRATARRGALEHRTAAWHRLLALSAPSTAGSTTTRLRLPAYGGSLFDPDRFPWLEGARPRGTAAHRSTTAPCCTCSRAVQYVAARHGAQPRAAQLSFRALDVEQIGYVYEGLLDLEGDRAADVVVGLVGKAGPGGRGRARRAGGLAGRRRLAAATAGRAASKDVGHRLGQGARRSGSPPLDRAEREAARSVLRAVVRQTTALAERLLPFDGLLRTRPARPAGRRSCPARCTSPSSALRRTPAPTTRRGRWPRRSSQHALEPLSTSPGPLQTADAVAVEAPVAARDPGAQGRRHRHGLGRVPRRRLPLPRPTARRGLGPRGRRDRRGPCATDTLPPRRRRGPGRRRGPPAGHRALPLRRRHQPDGRRDGEAVAVAGHRWTRERPFTFLDDRLVAGDSLLGLTSLEQLEYLHLDPKQAASGTRTRCVAADVRARSQRRPRRDGG